MIGYRGRTVLMFASLALGWHTLQEDRVLQAGLQVQQGRLSEVTEQLQADLSELRARRDRLSPFCFFLPLREIPYLLPTEGYHHGMIGCRVPGRSGAASFH